MLDPSYPPSSVTKTVTWSYSGKLVCHVFFSFYLLTSYL